ncbi:hypothetical protein BJY04DRAFT_204096 [Aspergillus karnatakaensis]|uniref:uncharacterized protein n=1 Tax=Aspergillus karnatakaensis TaxID=1810916 RepID=UPI003CCD4E1C
MTLTISPTSLPEQLFLDLSNQEVHDSRSQFKEPWKIMYVDAIHDRRLGDAVWARYHIYGEQEYCPGDPAINRTVQEQIKEDALGYRVNAPGEYFQALLFYAATSAADGHADVLGIIANLSEEEIAEF